MHSCNRFVHICTCNETVTSLQMSLKYLHLKCTANNCISFTLSIQEDFLYVHAEMLAVYGLACPDKGGDSLVTDSSIQLPAPADHDGSLYCLVIYQ